MNQENNVLTICSIQIQPFRNLIMAMKDILVDATMFFTKDGIKIINLDSSNTIFVDVVLHAKKFEVFECEPAQIVISVDVGQLFKLISSISNNDTLSVYIKRSNYKAGVVDYLSLQYDNGSIKQSRQHNLKVFDYEETETLLIPDMEYSLIINLPTTDFQKIIRDLHSISDRVEIQSIGSELIFFSKSDMADSRICRSENDGYMQFLQKPSDASVVIQGLFSLKSLSQFIKCTPLCSNLEIYLANDHPMIVKYSVASLGEVRLCLVQLTVDKE